MFLKFRMISIWIYFVYLTKNNCFDESLGVYKGVCKYLLGFGTYGTKLLEICIHAPMHIKLSKYTQKY